MGASGVLGSHMCQALIQQGATVIATSSNEATANKIASGVGFSTILDLTNSSSIELAAANIVNNAPIIDGVINCAGRVGFGPIAQTTLEQASQLMQINHLGPAHFYALLLPALSAACENNGEAFIAGITGVVAERSFPGLAAYGESKLAASRHLAAIAQEFRRAKLRTVDARPGHTETGLATRPLFGEAPSFPTGMSPESVVSRILQGIAANESEIPSTSF